MIIFSHFNLLATTYANNIIIEISIKIIQIIYMIVEFTLIYNFNNNMCLFHIIVFIFGYYKLNKSS